MQADAAEPAQQFEAVLFDLDGTLADTLPDLAGALDSVARETGAGTVDEARLRPLVSRGTGAMLASVFAHESGLARLDHARRRFLERYREGVAVRTRLFPGMDAVLDTIERRGVRWGVVTNKHAWLTEPLLEALGLRRRAACVVSGDSAAHPKPHPAPLLLACERLSIAPGAAAYVGDSRSDVESGRAAGMVTLSAGWGYFDPEDPPVRWGADAVAGTPGDLLAWIRSALAGREG